MFRDRVEYRKHYYPEQVCGSKPGNSAPMIPYLRPQHHPVLLSQYAQHCQRWIDKHPQPKPEWETVVDMGEASVVRKPDPHMPGCYIVALVRHYHESFIILEDSTAIADPSHIEAFAAVVKQLQRSQN